MIIGIFFLVLQTILAFLKPKYFIFTYLFFYSSFLGFLPKSIIISGYEIGFFYQSVLMLGSYFFYFKRTKKYPTHIKLLLISIILFFFYGVFYPALNGLSSFNQSIIASKEFSSLFLINYLFVNRKKISYDYLIKILSFFGYYFLIVLFLFVVFHYIPPQYIKESGRIQYYSPVLLSLFLFIKMVESNSMSKKIFALILLTVWTIGMLREGHDAIAITTSLGCLIVLFRLPIIIFLKNYKRILLVLSSICFLLPTKKYITEFNQINAIKSRSNVNKGRMAYISDRPLLGYGFLYKDDFALAENNQSTLSEIDSGYIDLFGKFGFIGTIIFLIILIPPFFSNQRSHIMITSLKIFFLQFFAVNLTWAVFTFSMGTIPLSLAIYLIYLHNNNIKYQSIKFRL